MQNHYIILNNAGKEYVMQEMHKLHKRVGIFTQGHFNAWFSIIETNHLNTGVAYVELKSYETTTKHTEIIELSGLHYDIVIIEEE